MRSLALGALAAAAVAAAAAPLNFVIVISDDMGYNDASVYGHPTIRSPNVDKMAAKGLKFTQFSVAAPVCTPSRGALLTGRLPLRLGLYSRYGFPVDNFLRVFLPSSVEGLPGEEVTIADSLKGAGYATAAIGKWHLGSNPATNCTPTQQGFDYSYSILYSHEEGFPGPAPAADIFPPVPLTENGRIVEQPVQLETVGARYVQRATQFLDAVAPGGAAAAAAAVGSSSENTGSDAGPLPPIPGVKAGQPFFLYFAPASTHVPIYAEEKYHNVSRRGPYGDAAVQTDAALGAVLAALEAKGLMDNTVVFYTSDNGAWIDPSNGLGADPHPLEGGSNAPFRGGKGSTWEGGVREPALLMAPPHVLAPALVGTVNQDVVSALDLLPTFRDLAGLPPAPHNVTLDGVSWRAMLANNVTDALSVGWGGALPTGEAADAAALEKAAAWAATYGTGRLDTPPGALHAAPAAAPATSAAGPSSGMLAARALLAALGGGASAGQPAAAAAATAVAGLRAAGGTHSAEQLVGAWAQGMAGVAAAGTVPEISNPAGTSTVVGAGEDVAGPFCPLHYAPGGAGHGTVIRGGEEGAAAALGGDGTAPPSRVVRDWVWYWRDNVLYAARYGPYKAAFYTRPGFGWDAPVVHKPALLFQVEHDPAERLPLNTTLQPYAAMEAYITTQAQAYVQGMLPQARDSRYLAMDWSLVPCCHKTPNATRAAQFWEEGLYGLSIYEECVCSGALTPPTA